MTINEAMTALCDELSTEVPDVLTQPLTLALVWLDLCRLVGEEPPADVAALAEAPIPIRPLRSTSQHLPLGTTD